MSNLVPTNLKILRGNPGKRPLRPEPDPSPLQAIPAPPDFLMPAAQDEWRRIIIELDRLNLVTFVDLYPLAAYCQAYARWKQAEEALAKMADKDTATNGILIKGLRGMPVHNPLMRAAIRAAKDMVDHAAEFGLTPAARARIAAGVYEPRTQSKFDGLLAG